jgi:hypothetical protein
MLLAAARGVAAGHIGARVGGQSGLRLPNPVRLSDAVRLSVISLFGARQGFCRASSPTFVAI